MGNSNKASDLAVSSVVQMIIEKLLPFDEESRIRVIRTASTFFEIDSDFIQPNTRDESNRPSIEPTFSNREEVSPKDFLFQKQPITDVERVVCLAFYLSHFRDTPFLKTIDISRLNTEAAQIKFSNTAAAVANASRAGLLAGASKGSKQISAMGEKFVEALPDRTLAKEVQKKMNGKRRRKSSKSK